MSLSPAPAACVELWNPERWAPIESEGLDPENLAAAMEELGF